MSANGESIRKLVAAARKAYGAQPAVKPAAAPLGFATRVAARWAGMPRRPGWAEAWERLCWWGAGASAAICLVAFVHQSLEPEPNPFDVLIEAQAGASDMM